MRPLPSRRAKRPVAILAILAILSLLIVSLSGPTISGVARQGNMKVTAKGDAALAKLHPQLRRDASATPDAMIRVHAYVKAGTDLSAFMSNAVTRTYVDPRGYTGVTGFVKARELPKLASVANVNAVMPMGGFAPAVDADTTIGRTTAPSAEVQAKMRAAVTSRAANYSATRDPGTPSPTGWFDVLDVHHSSAAWDKGYTGAGVKALVNDSGIDFSHPDLIGTEARVEDPNSPYYGWPMQFDQFGMLQYASDVQAGTTNLANGNAGGYADTSTVVTEGAASYMPLNADEAHDYTLTGTSASGNYQIGTHPDGSLSQWYRIVNGIDLGDPEAADESPAILVVDEGAAGVYDTVYVDLNFNFDFSDDKAARKGDEHVGADWWGAFDPETGDFDAEPDGFYDESGGMLYFIADGTNPIPASDWWWGLGAPANGSMVAFSMSQWWTSPAGDHGQLVASGIAAQGRTNADSYDSIFGATQQDRDTGGIVPPWKPEGASGMLTAAGKDVKLVDSGDFYSNGYIDAFAFAALGYDGVPDTDDDIQFINNSWGGPAIDAGYDSFSRLVDYYQRFLNPSLLSASSTGNDGPGYGSASTPATQSGLNVGASSSYGSTGWDSAVGADQINYNDVVSFSSRGPGRLGDAFVDVVASGNRSSGAMALNEAFSGPHAWVTWGGTSRSTPVAIGNAALMYQAYKEKFGRWPDQNTARAILKSGAQDLRYDPFLQGSGSIDGNRAVDIATGAEGAWYVTPDEWSAGNWDGTQYGNFPKVMMPGETADIEFTVHNTSDTEMYLDVSDRWLQHTGQWQQQFTSSPVSEESVTISEDDPPVTDFNWDQPQYLWNVTDQIPEESDILVFRQNFGFDQWNPTGGYDSSQLNDWYLMAYNWKDIDGDGNLWEDADGNGTVNEGEMDEGEYTRFDYSNQRDNAGFLSLRNPLDRVHDGFFIALMHNQARADVPTTDMLLTMDFYQQTDFEWLSTYSSQVYVGAHDKNVIKASIQLPSGTPIGTYEAAIEVSGGNWTTAVPVTINVAARDSDMNIGGQDIGTEIYQNDGVYGAVDWLGGDSSGDWRIYFANLPENVGGIRSMPKGQQYWLVDTDWQDMPTDINAHILSPTLDQFSELFPEYFGPYTLAEAGGSDEGYTGSGIYLIQTSSGDSREVVSAPYTPGLNEIVLHNVTYDGNSTMEDFTLRAGAIGVGVSPIDVSRNANQANHSVNETFVSTMQLSGLVAEGYGLSKPDVKTGVAIQQDDPNDPSTASYKQEITLEHAGLLDVQIDGTDRDDLDLYVLYDFNGDGELTLDEIVGQSATSTAEESVTFTLPNDGLYGIWVQGWAVAGGESTFDISVNAVQGTDITVSDLPEGTIEAGRTYNFKVDVMGEGKEPGVYTGLVTLGPPEGPSAVLVFVNYRIKE